MKVRLRYAEVDATRVPRGTRDVVASTLGEVQGDLALPPIHARWFKWSPRLIEAEDYAVADLPFAVLNTASSDRTLGGKALALPTPMVWIRASLRGRLVRMVTAHEARHVWQQLTWTSDGDERLDPEFAERDAEEYADDFLRRFDVT